MHLDNSMLALRKKMIKYILIIFIFIQIIFAQTDSTELVTYNWLGKNAEVNISSYEVQIKTPKGYKPNHWYYGEGVLTTLLFPDSSLITLHFGFTMKIPLLDEPEFLVKEKDEFETIYIRRGINKKTKQYWEEHNFKKMPINISYSNVSKEKIKFYQNILNGIIIKNRTEKTKSPSPPHPDSIGIGTDEYKNGIKMAIKDFSNNTSHFYLIGLIRMDSLEIKKMKMQFDEKYKLTLHFEGCEGGDAFLNGYNNTIKELIENKYKIDLRNEIHKWTNKH